MSPFQAKDNTFQTAGSLWVLPKIDSSAGARGCLSKVYSAGQCQWHFTSGFGLRHKL